MGFAVQFEIMHKEEINIGSGLAQSVSDEIILVDKYLIEPLCLHCTKMGAQVYIGRKRPETPPSGLWCSSPWDPCSSFAVLIGSKWEVCIVH